MASAPNPANHPAMRREVSGSVESKHTPGPWIATVDDLVPERGFAYIEARTGSDLETIAEAYRLDSGDTDEREANARLIAAAPDMLEALRDLKANIEKLRWGQSYPGRNHALMDRVDAVLAKAEGR